MKDAKIDLELSITLETRNGTVEVPISDDDAFQVRGDGVYLDGTLTFWEDIICVIICNRDYAKYNNKGTNESPIANS